MLQTFIIIFFILLVLYFVVNAWDKKIQSKMPPGQKQIIEEAQKLVAQGVNINDAVKQAKEKLEASKHPAVPAVKLFAPEDYQYVDFYTYVAGASRRTDSIGGFWGVVVAEPTNAYNPNAMAIITDRGLLGYIPDSDLDEYREWSGAQTCPCLGYVYKEEGQIRARVKVITPNSPEYIKQQFGKYTEWIAENRGQSYLPNNPNWTITQ